MIACLRLSGRNCLVVGGGDIGLEKVEGRRLIFHVSARDERGLIAAGKVTRVIVDRARFLEKAR